MTKEIVKKNQEISDVALDENVKSYFEAMLLLTPNVFKTESYAINLYQPLKNQPEVSVVRFCVEYDNFFATQDELFFPSVNEGAKVNFEFTRQFEFKKAPDNLSKLLMQFIDKFRALATDKGAFISVMGYGIVYVSDGEKWVRKRGMPNYLDAVTGALIANGELISKSKVSLNQENE